MGMKTPPQLAETRRLNLKRLITERFDGNIAAFCRATGKNPNLMALVLSTNLAIKRTIGERQAREIEGLVNLPERWMDVERGASIDEKFHTFDVVDVAALGSTAIEKLTLSVSTLSRHIEPYSAIGAVKCVRAMTSEMAPDVNSGDLLFVDTLATAYDRPGIYVIARGEAVFIRRVRPLLSGQVRISSGSESDAVDADPKEYASSGRVVGILRFAKP